MRLGVAAVLAALALPAGMLAAAGDHPAAGKGAPSAGTSPAAKPAKARPRNPVDRSSSDPAAATFRSFDADGDGHVSREEARESAELSRRFNELDRNRDGRLSLGEMSGWRNVSYRVTVSNKPHIPGEEPGYIPPTLHSSTPAR